MEPAVVVDAAREKLNVSADAFGAATVDGVAAGAAATAEEAGVPVAADETAVVTLVCESGKTKKDESQFVFLFHIKESHREIKDSSITYLTCKDFKNLRELRPLYDHILILILNSTSTITKTP